MWHRVREVLLVSSPYDAFILQQDGPLTEQVYREYRGLHLPAPPRFTHVATGTAAINRLKKRRFDLVLAMTSLADMRVNSFGRKVKNMRPGRPVVLLSLDRKELQRVQHKIDREVIDGVFLWNGSARILAAITHFIEDRENVEHDVKHGNLRVIIVIEDNISYYSAFLGLLYQELSTHAWDLYQEGLNSVGRRMYMQSRPKVLLATSYEEGMELFRKYRKHVLAIISDIGLPRKGKQDPRAGLRVIRRVRKVDPDLPILLQSAESKYGPEATDLRVGFIDKNSPRLLERLGYFLRDSLGFGPFIFRLSNGKQVAQATDLHAMEETLPTVPTESLEYHAKHNHFSVWLATRSEFDLADQIRPIKANQFEDIDSFRRFLIGALHMARRDGQRGVVADFDRRRFLRDPFVRLGSGPLGGKARGLAFLHRLLAHKSVNDFGGLEVTIPKTVVITTEHFDAFIDQNGLRDFAVTCGEDHEVTRRFLAGRLPKPLFEDLKYIILHIKLPLAVRSSSLLEDSKHQRLAGIYATFMLANSGPAEERLRQACDAIKRVYASTFYGNARAYLERTGRRMEEDKMAVVLQEVVGQRYRSLFYPLFSGVAQSYNFYPIRRQQPEDGVAHIALGFGRQVVEGGAALRFSPRNPEEIPQFSKPKALLDTSQRRFFALDMDQECCTTGALFASLAERGLEVAEKDGTLRIVGSVYSPEDRMIRDDLRLPGPRLVTFNNLLKHRAIPLADALAEVLKLGRESFGEAVEIEFAGDLGDRGKHLPKGQPRREPKLYLLQIRPFLGHDRSGGDGAHLRFRDQDLLGASSRAMGHGILETIRDILYIRTDRWDAALNQRIAEEVGQLNKVLHRSKRPYLLIGPGRWGTADPWLGIPVQWSQISNVGAIIETSPPGREVEPSQGTHFFQNLTALEIPYFTLPAGAECTTPATLPHRNDKAPTNFLDRGWLDTQKAHHETDQLRHLRFENAITLALDGRHGTGQITKPGAQHSS
jgi:DNA-binding NarL/FixJ family response regulator